MRRIIRSLLYTLACASAIALLAGARGNTAVAGTTVSGYISADTTWTAANSPYSVSGNVIVRSGATLTIEPGVTVNFGTDKSLQVDGTLIAKGTSAGKITFTGGSWAYILLSDTSIDATYDHSGNYVSGSILEYCVVEYAGGTSVSDNGALRLNNAHPCINYCTIRNNSAPGIYAYNISGTLRITNSTITDNNSSASGGAGVYVSHSSGGSTTISGNTIKNNTSSYYGYGGGIYIAYGTVTLTNNTISGNTGSSSGWAWAYGGGIYIDYYSTITLTNNTISGNTASSSSGGANGGGIYIADSTITLTNNTISSNTASSSDGGEAYGGGIYKHYSSTITLTNNTISVNTAKNAAAVYYTGSNDGKDFKYNTITGNKTTGGSDTYAVYVNSYPLINYNNIYDNTTTYELWFDKSQGSANLDAKNNWWGSSDEKTVQDKIYDGMDSSAKALVDYYPYSTTIRTDAGVTVTTTPTPTPTVTTSPSPTPAVSPTTSPAPTLPPLPTPAPTLPPLPTPQVSPSPIQDGIVFGIVNDQDELPLKGVTITITGKNSSDSTETDEDGYYEFRGLSQGAYALTYEKEGYLDQTQDISLNEGEIKDLGTVTMEQVVKGKISGYVVNIKGDPIESVRLKLKGIKTKVIKTASSDADGFFEFTDLDADTYVIFAKKKGYKKTQHKVVLEEGESTEIEIEMRKTTKRIKLEGIQE